MPDQPIQFADDPPDAPDPATLILTCANGGARWTNAGAS